MTHNSGPHISSSYQDVTRLTLSKPVSILWLDFPPKLILPRSIRTPWYSKIVRKVVPYFEVNMAPENCAFSPVGPSSSSFSTILSFSGSSFCLSLCFSRSPFLSRLVCYVLWLDRSFERSKPSFSVAAACACLPDEVRGRPPASFYQRFGFASATVLLGTKCRDWKKKIDPRWGLNMFGNQQVFQIRLGGFFLIFVLGGSRRTSIMLPLWKYNDGRIMY